MRQADVPGTSTVSEHNVRDDQRINSPMEMNHVHTGCIPRSFSESDTDCPSYFMPPRHLRNAQVPLTEL